MKEYDILEERDRNTLIRMINEKAKDNWHLINFIAVKGTYDTTFYAVLEREIDENPSIR